jgi:hypothetical protein
MSKSRIKILVRCFLPLTLSLSFNLLDLQDAVTHLQCQAEVIKDTALKTWSASFHFLLCYSRAKSCFKARHTSRRHGITLFVGYTGKAAPGTRAM